MKKVFLILIFSGLLICGQNKYYIYFKDKVANPKEPLNKTTALYKHAEKLLSAESVERRKAVMGEEYITFEDLPLNENYIAGIEALGIKIENKLRWFNAVTSYLTKEQTELVSKLPFVRKLETVKTGKVQRRKEAIDPFLTGAEFKIDNSINEIDYGYTQTQLALSDVQQIHSLGLSGKDVYVGVLDNGFNWKTHRALSGLNVVQEYDYVERDGNTSNLHYHGTAVFSMLGGFDPGYIIGPAYSAKFFLAKTENDAGESKAEEDNYAAALQDMESAGVQITNSSLGYTEFDDTTTNYKYKDLNGQTAISTKAVNLAFQRGMFLITSAGNEGNDKWRYVGTPADAFNVIAVGAVDKNNLIAGFSSRGPTYDGRIKPEVCAMGVYNSYALPNGKYGSGSGTSYSAPIVAGIAALLKSTYPGITNLQMRKMFLEGCDNSGFPNNDRGYGLLSAVKVISYPVLEKEGASYKLNKIFIHKDGVNSSTIKLNYKIDGDDFKTALMNYDGQLKYNFVIPNSASGTSVEFYFNYSTANGNKVREPAVGNYKFSYSDLLVYNLTSIEENGIIPTEFELLQNYPNPFNPETVISFNVPEQEKVTLKIFDALGRETATLVDDFVSAGKHRFIFSNNKFRLASGVYYYQITAGNFREVKKMLLLK